MKNINKDLRKIAAKAWTNFKPSSGNNSTQRYAAIDAFYTKIIKAADIIIINGTREKFEPNILVDGYDTAIKVADLKQAVYLDKIYHADNFWITVISRYDLRPYEAILFCSGEYSQKAIVVFNSLSAIEEVMKDSGNMLNILNI